MLFLATALACNSFLPADRALSTRSAGQDFAAFYTAGTFIRTGRVDGLYNLGEVSAFQRDLAERDGLQFSDDKFAPYWNPPLFGWLFVPLSVLAYPAAWWTWTAFNLACLAAAMALLCRMLVEGLTNVPADWRTWALVPLLTITSMPFLQAIGHGQNACLSLLIVAGTVTCWRRGWWLSAGLTAGLLFYKPQLGAVLAAVLVASGGWRAAAGLAMAGFTVLIATMLSLPGALGAFLQRLAHNVALLQEQTQYVWDRHVTLKAFWRLLLQGDAIGPMSSWAIALQLATVVLVGACLVAWIWKSRRDRLPAQRDRVIATTIIATPLLMPFYFDYDLLLLAVPAVLTARQSLAAGVIDRLLVAVWIALAGWLIVNPLVARSTDVIGAVVLLSVLAGMMMSRTARMARSGESAEAAESAIADGTVRRAA